MKKCKKCKGIIGLTEKECIKKYQEKVIDGSGFTIIGDSRLRTTTFNSLRQNLCLRCFRKAKVVK